MISKIAYLVHPGPGRYVLCYQTFGSDELFKIEIPADQMRLIMINGVDMMLRESFHPIPQTEREHERA